MSVDISYETVAMAMGVLFLFYLLIGQQGKFFEDMAKFAVILVIPVAIIYLMFKYVA